MWTKLKEFVFFENDMIRIDLVSLLLILVLLIIAVLAVSLIGKLVKKLEKHKHVASHFARYLLQGGRLLIWISFSFLVLETLNVKSSVFFNYVLYAGDKFKLQIFNIFIILVVLYIVRGLTFLVEYWFDIRIENKKLDKGRGKSFLQIVKYLVWMMGFVVAIGSLGFQITLIIASVSALLIGVGFGLQHIFNDFFSGIIILFDGSIEVDDVVEMEGVVGRVLEIGLRVSKVLTRDNVVIIVPNSRFTGQNVINWSHNADVTRFYVSVGVAYGSDIRLVERILLEAAKDHSQIVKTPAPFARFRDFGESSLDFELYFWTANDFMVENIKSDLRFEIDFQFRENKVEIPFPQRDLHLKSKSFDS